MCGILVTSRLNRPFHHRQLKSLKRRGPDEIGFWSDQHVQIAHSRLSIIGLDERGTQPLENDRHVLAYNGEIYNFAEIRNKLSAAGVQVPGVTDSEVLLHAWSLWGAKVLTELQGFWSFVIYDKVARTLTLVRDQFGVKPLYYMVSREHGICVASMIRTILEIADMPRDLDMLAMSEYVRYQFTFGDKTFLKAIKKVMPGEVVEIKLDSGDVHRSTYEDIFEEGAPQAALTEDWLAETRELLAQCVVDSTISDTSFTTFCSGGIDSSLITRLASPEVAYHCNFSDPDCNETYFAKQVVENTSTRLFVVNADESFNLVEKLSGIVEDFDELSIGSVVIPLEDLLAQVKRRYKVILTGTGGDEMFAGYVRFQMVMGECYQDSYKALFAKMKKLGTVNERFELTHRKGNVSFFKFYQPEAENEFQTAFEDCRSNGNDLHAMLRFDRRYFLRGLLNIDDKMCGRHSLESRPSFLHQKLVRHMMKLDPRALFYGGELKPVLRRLAEGTLPKAVIHRTDKMGFTTPIGTFVNHSTHLIREQITNSHFRDLYETRGMHFAAEDKFSREVFGLLMLDLWLNRYAR
jgi:asparagine synthase (glutamine-hydrolysing)